MNTVDHGLPWFEAASFVRPRTLVDAPTLVFIGSPLNGEKSPRWETIFSFAGLIDYERLYRPRRFNAGAREMMLFGRVYSDFAHARGSLRRHISKRRFTPCWCGPVTPQQIEAGFDGGRSRTAQAFMAPVTPLGHASELDGKDLRWAGHRAPQVGAGQTHPRRPRWGCLQPAFHLRRRDIFQQRRWAR